MEQIMRDGFVKEFEAEHYRKDRRRIWVSINSRISLNHAGVAGCFESTIEDITVRKKAEEALKRYSARLEQLRDLDMEILEASTGENIAGIVAGNLGGMLSCKGVSVTEFDFDRNMAVVVAVLSDAGTQFKKGSEISFDGLDLKRMLSEGPLVFHDLQTEGPVSDVRARLLGEDIRSVVIVPMEVEKKIIGSLNMTDTEPGKFTAEDVETAVEASRVLTIGLQQSDLRKRIKTQLDDLEREIERRTKTEISLRSALQERDVLLREVHHRVKNNLQAMIFLMELHRERSCDPGLEALFRDLEGKARTMSLVYEQIYQAETLVDIDMGDYLPNIVYSVLQHFDTEHHVEAEIAATSVFMDIEKTMSIGLIVNELVTNAMKHAYPPGFTGPRKINVSLTEEETFFRLFVADTGIGMPDTVDVETTSTMGLRLVRLWVAHQLGGALTIDRTGGTSYTVLIPKKFSRERS